MAITGVASMHRLTALSGAGAIVTVRTDSALGAWTQSEWLPPPGHQLAGAVERVWYFDGTLTYGCERLFPNGKLEIVIQLDTPHRPAGALERYPALALSGMQLSPLVIEAPWGRCRVLGIRLTPAGARAILRAPLGEFVDATVSLEALTGRTASDLAGRCHAARSGAAVVSEAIAWSEQRAGAARYNEDWLGWSLARIEATAGNVSLAALRAQTGRTAKRFSEPFAREIGVTPKRYARLMRFRRTIAALQDDATAIAAGRASLAEVAYGAGYYDQAHMHAEFREHAGMTPGEFLRAQKYPGSLSLPESHR